MRHIGIIGGTFNPIHLGHLAVAEAAIEKLPVDKVIFVPSFLPPHKTSRGVIDAHQRIEMVKLAIEGNPRFEVSDYEIEKGGKSYTIDTIKFFREKYSPDTKFYFIIGQDNYTNLTKWKDVDSLHKLVKFIVVNRPAFTGEELDQKVKFLIMPAVHVSSSDIRKMVAAGESIRYFVPDSVADYIKRHKLYLTE